MSVKADRIAAAAYARPWLLVAAVLVGISAVFAVMVALARVPAVGALLPGDGFYQAALTMHVTFSQGAWFAAFASALLATRRGFDSRAGVGLIGLAAAVMLVSLSRGPVPLMSNYFPVLDDPLFLGGGLVIAAVLLVNTAAFLLDPPAEMGESPQSRCLDSALRLFAIQVWVAAALGVEAMRTLPPEFSRLEMFETLFWGAGHAWQFALVTLMIAVWSQLAGLKSAVSLVGIWTLVLVLAAIPTLWSVVAVLRHETGSAAQFLAHTDAMRYASWLAPVLFFAWLAFRVPELRRDPGFVGTIMLLGTGLWLGTRINGETTMVTAHYHGAVGAVSLSLMWWAVRGSSADAVAETPRASTGALLYALGIWLMMVGLAGAGWSGAPRKTAGDLSLTLSIETMSRFALGVGGLLATLGLLGFAWGVIGNGFRRRARPNARARI